MLFMTLSGFIQAKALNLKSLPLIVYPAIHCRRHCVFAMLSGFLESVNSPSFVRSLVALENTLAENTFEERKLALQ